ncbi:UDP-glucose 6-dehydrogenase AglM [uncultured archaeon]|nr:UDP-glucose 6-dehydrogenase AglM [uncultured archaeon]
MNIGIIGVGFVGGATAHTLKGTHDLYLYDKYKEPHNSKKNLEELSKNSECVFVCVPTPMKKSGEIDYTNIHNSIEQLLEETKNAQRDPKDLLVIIRSTAVSGTTDNLAEKYPFKFAFNPEFLRERYAIEDMEKTSRIIIGANEPEISKKVEEIYKPRFPKAVYIKENIKTAEMIKYAANCMLAGQVALANEFYQICKVSGVDYDSVKNAILLDDRIGKNLQVPGPDGDLGFGGKCFPKDLNALIYLSRENMYRPYLLEEIWRLNEKVRKNKDWLEIEGATTTKNFEENKK